MAVPALPYRELAAAAIFLLTVTAIVTRPRRVDESISAAIGALAMLAPGVESPVQALGMLASQWNLFLFFLGLMLVSGLADAAGFFDAAGALAAGAAHGSGRLLLVSVFLAGAVITAFLSNDATALILTPVVYSVVMRLRLPPLPYLFATTFVADTASMTLPVSNPINILVSDRLHLGLGAYAGHLLAASVALAYLAASAVQLPLGAVAAGGAVLLAALALAARNLQPTRIREHVSPSLFLYVASLLVLVRGVEQAGLTSAVVGVLAGLAQGPVSAVGAGLGGAALSANLINNVPATLVLVSGAFGGHLAVELRLPFLLGALAGADLGPNLTPVGSLSTILWLEIVRRRGVEVSSLQYLKLGALVTPVLLLAAGLTIAATFR